MPEPATGIILAGGKSRRMGQDKAFLLLDGAPLIAHVLRALRPVVQELLIVTDDARKFAAAEATVVEDLFPGAHALGGLYTGLLLATHDRCIVTACDAPFLNPQLARFFLDEVAGYEAAMPRSRRGLQPLPAVYTRGCLVALERQRELEQWALQALVSHVRVNVIEPAAIHHFDPDERSFWNLNTPGEFAQACAQMEVREHASSRS